MNGEVIQEFREEDLAAVTDIYNYYVLHSTATWHTHPLTEADMRQLVFTGNNKYKTFVIKDGDAVFGYVSIREFKPRGRVYRNSRDWYLSAGGLLRAKATAARL